MKNRLFPAAVLILLCFVLSSCSVIGNIRSETEARKYEYEVLTELINKKSEILDVLALKPDKEKFIALFCEKVRESEGFIEQVDSLFSFISVLGEADGDKEKAEYMPLSGEKSGVVFSGKEKTDWYLTDTGYGSIINAGADNQAKKYYGYDFYYQVTDKAAVDEVGLHYLTFYFLNTDKQITVGTNEFTN